MRILKDNEYLLQQAKYLCNDINQANELFQDTLVKCWKAGKCDEAKEYGKKVMRSIFIDNIRKQSRNRIVELNQDFHDEVIERINNTDLIKKALLILDQKASSRITTDVFILHYFYGLKYREIAQKVGLKNSNLVGSRIINAKKIIKKHLLDKQNLTRDIA